MGRSGRSAAIKAEPIALEVTFQDNKVELYGAAPLWARRLFTEKKKAKFKEQLEAILHKVNFVGAGEEINPSQAKIPAAQAVEQESAHPAPFFGAPPKPSRATSHLVAQSGLRIVPSTHGVSIWSSALFGDPSDLHIREFLSCVFSVKGVTAVEIRRSEAFGWVRYDPSTNVPEILRKLSQALKQSAVSCGGAPMLAGTNYDGRRPLGIQSLYLDGPRSSPIRVNRVGAAVSTWHLRYQSRHKVTSSIRY
jgi:hypothetical protein